MPRSPRDRFFGAFVSMAHRHPAAVVVVIVLACVAGLGIGSRIDLNTSRYDMVRPDDPYQARLLGFFEEFGYPDTPVAMVRGGTAEDRRRTVDRLTSAYEADPMFEGRVLGHVGAREVAEVVLLQQPDALARLRASLPPDADVAAVVEAGLPGMMGAIEDQLLAGLDGEVVVDEKEAAEGMQRLAGMARLLDRVLAGEDVSTELGNLAPERAPAPAIGLDDEGYVVSRDRSYLLLALFPDMGGTRVEDYTPVVERTQEIQAAVEAEGLPDGVEILLTGLPVLVIDEEEVLAEGILQSGIASGIGVVALLLLSFRSIRSTIYALVPLTLGMGITLGLVQLIYGHLNPITAGIFAMLLGLGIDFAVHLLARFQEFLRAGATRADAIEGAWLGAGPGVLTGALTSVLAFLTVVTAMFTAFSEYGVNSALGLLVVFVVTMFLLPVLLARFGGGEAAPKVPGVESLPRLVRLAPRLGLVAALLAASAGIYAATTMRFNARYFDYLPQELESVQALDVMEKDGAMSPVFAYASADDLDAAREMTARLRELDTVGSVQTPTDLLPELDADRLAALGKGFEGLARDPDFAKLTARSPSAAELSKKIGGVVDALDELRFALEQGGRPTADVDAARSAFLDLRKRVDGLPDDGKAELSRVEGQMADVLGRAWRVARAVVERGTYAGEDLPPLFARRYLSKDGQGRVAMFVFPDHPIWGEGEAERFADEVRSVDEDAAGHAISMHIHNEMIVSDFVRAALLAVGIVFVVLFLDFRRISDTLLALVPVLVGGCWTAGLMVLAGVQFSVGNIMVAPFLIGLGIDAGVHMVHRARQSQEEHGTGRLEDLLGGTGSAVLVASVTTIVGFGGLMLADYGALFDFGLTMVLGVGSTLLSTLLVLPALLLVFHRAK